jgi:aldehyde dehydrogenase (NAD+)
VERLPDGRFVPQAYPKFDLLPIAGLWRPGGSTKRLQDRNPYNGAILVELQQCDRADLDLACEEAAKRQPGWAGALPADRAAVMSRAAQVMELRREEIVTWLVQESGSVRIKAELEWQWAHDVFLEAAALAHRVEGRLLPVDMPGKESQAHRKPVGVVGVIGPWNWPLHLCLRSVSPALVLGNAVVLKPSSDTPVTAGLLPARILEEAGLPAGLLSVLAGSGSEVGEPLVLHPAPRVISFTGSTAVGRHVARLAMESPLIKRLELELGGNTPFVVLADADVERAVDAAIFGKFLHQGQICMAVNRFIVDDAVYDEFLGRFLDRVRRLKYGDPDMADTLIGPLINESQLEKARRRVRETEQAGARLAVGGEPQGLVLPPHVFTGVTNAMPATRHEWFAPVAPILRVAGEEDALASANDTEYGLSGTVFTRDVERGRRFALRMQTGMAHVNDQPVNDLRFNPFGGEKNSGLGRFNGAWAIGAFTTDQWVSLQHEPRRYPF